MSIEEILAQLRAIIDGAVNEDGEERELTDDEVQRYEDLERTLTVSRRSAELRARQRAYESPVSTPALITGGRKPDTLERAFESYLRTGQANQDLVELRAQSEGVSTAGGYTVPTVMRQKIVERMVSFGGIAGEVEALSTGTGTPIEYPTLDDTANSGTITAENAAMTGGADLAFDTVAIGAYKYTSSGASDAPLKVSVELAQDSAFDLTGLVTRAMGTRLARAQSAHWATGTGVNQPKGLVASSLTKDRDLDTADTPDYEDLVGLQDLLDEAYEPNAVWVMRKNTWSQLRLIVDTAGRPIIQDSTAGIGEKPQKLLLGSRVVIDPAMPLLSSAGITLPIAYGDLREAYVIRRVTPLTIMVNPYSSASSGQIEYTAWERADGNIQNRHAYVIMRNNT